MIGDLGSTSDWIIPLLVFLAMGLLLGGFMLAILLSLLEGLIRRAVRADETIELLARIERRLDSLDTKVGFSRGTSSAPGESNPRSEPQDG